MQRIQRQHATPDWDVQSDINTNALRGPSDALQYPCTQGEAIGCHWLQDMPFEPVQ